MTRKYTRLKRVDVIPDKLKDKKRFMINGFPFIRTNRLRECKDKPKKCIGCEKEYSKNWMGLLDLCEECFNKLLKKFAESMPDKECVEI